VDNIELIRANVVIDRAECALQGISVQLTASPVASRQGTSVSASGSGAGTGTVATVAVPRVRPEVPPMAEFAQQKALRFEGQHGQPATKQHSYIYNYNPVANGGVAVSTAGPPLREPV
jgi:hypothetical protein